MSTPTKPPAGAAPKAQPASGKTETTAETAGAAEKTSDKAAGVLMTPQQIEALKKQIADQVRSEVAAEQAAGVAEAKAASRADAAMTAEQLEAQLSGVNGVPKGHVRCLALEAFAVDPQHVVGAIDRSGLSASIQRKQEVILPVSVAAALEARGLVRAL
jgi:hypothetical protein